MRKAGLKAFENDDEALNYLEKVAGELFDLANSFSGDKTGDVACTLHGAANKINQAIKIHNGKLDVVDAYWDTAQASTRAAKDIIMMRALDKEKNDA